MRKYTLLIWSLLLVFQSYSQSAEPTYTLYLLGDAGKVTDGQTNSIEVIKSQLRGENEAIIFLGDNIYQQGMPVEGHEERKNAEKYINPQIELAKEFNDRAYFIPGPTIWLDTSDDAVSVY